MALVGLRPLSTSYIFSSNWWFYFNAILEKFVKILDSILFAIRCKECMRCIILCFRNRQTPVSLSPAPTTTWSLSVLLSMSLLVPHLPLKSPTSWTRVSWSAQSVGPPIPPAVTGSSWHTLTTALPELGESQRFPAWVSGPLLTQGGQQDSKAEKNKTFMLHAILFFFLPQLKCFQIKREKNDYLVNLVILTFSRWQSITSRHCFFFFYGWLTKKVGNNWPRS